MRRSEISTDTRGRPLCVGSRGKSRGTVGSYDTNCEAACPRREAMWNLGELPTLRPICWTAVTEVNFRSRGSSNSIQVLHLYHFLESIYPVDITQSNASNSLNGCKLSMSYSHNLVTHVPPPPLIHPTPLPQSHTRLKPKTSPFPTGGAT